MLMRRPFGYDRPCHPWRVDRGNPDHFQGRPAEKTIMLTCVRRYEAYPLSDLSPKRPK
jgi:hypothetical protein